MKKLCILLILLMASWAYAGEDCNPCKEKIELARMTAVMAGAGSAAPAGCSNDCSGSKGDTFTDGTETSTLEFEIILNKIQISGCSETNPTIYGYVRDSATGTAMNIKFVIYDDDGAGGEPGTLLWTGTSTLINNTSFAWWSEVTSGDICLTGYYYVGAIFNINSGASYHMRKDTSGLGSRKVTDADFTPPATWPLDTDTHSTENRAFYLGF